VFEVEKYFYFYLKNYGYDDGDGAEIPKPIKNEDEI